MDDILNAHHSDLPETPASRHCDDFIAAVKVIKKLTDLDWREARAAMNNAAIKQAAIAAARRERTFLLRERARLLRGGGGMKQRVFVCNAQEYIEEKRRKGVLVETYRTTELCPSCGGAGMGCPDCCNGILEVLIVVTNEDEEEDK